MALLTDLIFSPNTSYIISKLFSKYFNLEFLYGTVKCRFYLNSCEFLNFEFLSNTIYFNSSYYYYLKGKSFYFDLYSVFGNIEHISKDDFNNFIQTYYPLFYHRIILGGDIETLRI